MAIAVVCWSWTISHAVNTSVKQTRQFMLDCGDTSVDAWLIDITKHVRLTSPLHIRTQDSLMRCTYIPIYGKRTKTCCLCSRNCLEIIHGAVRRASLIHFALSILVKQWDRFQIVGSTGKHIYQPDKPRRIPWIIVLEWCKEVDESPLRPFL